MAVDHETIKLVQVDPNDFDDFMALRQSVMQPHRDSQGLERDEDAEHEYHHHLFHEAGLFKIMSGNDRVGYIGINDSSHKDVKISRFCIDPQHQGGGIGGHILAERIFSIPAFADKNFVLEVLKENPALGLYESLGFERSHEKENVYFYRRQASSTE